MTPKMKMTTDIPPENPSDFTGQGKWQVGPVAVVGYLSEKWIFGAFVQKWTPFGGSGNRPDTNQMNLQPFAACFLPGGWSIGYSGNILANWKADSAGDVWTAPHGDRCWQGGEASPAPGQGRTRDSQYMVHHPDNFGQKWNLQLGVTPVIPNLIKGPLFDK